MKETKNIGSWLDSKQKTKVSLEVLKEYEEHYKTIDNLLKKRVVQQVKNPRTSIGRALYKAKDTYRDNMSFEEYVTSLMGYIGLEKMKELIDKSIEVICRKDKTIKERFTQEEIRKVVKSYIFYQPYVGFAFEQRIRDIIKENTPYDVVRSEHLDSTYAIDMQVVDYTKEKIIGLQLKSKSFLYTSIDKRQGYLDRNRQGILYKFCEDVCYVFHNEQCEIMSSNYESLVNYKVACNTQKPLILLEDQESFIKELNKKFESE